MESPCDVGERLLAAIGARDRAAIERCFAEDARFDVLTPHRLREHRGAAQVAERYAFWLDRLEQFEIVSGDVEPDRRSGQGALSLPWPRPGEGLAAERAHRVRSGRGRAHRRCDGDLLGLPADRGDELSEPRRWGGLLDGEELAHLATEPPAAGRTAPLPDDLDPAVALALDAAGIGSLYDHQAEAWEAARAGRHVVVTTGTASGKSLAFNLPVLHAVAADRVGPGAVPLPDEGARTGSGAGARVARQSRAPRRRSTTATRPASGDAHIRREANVVLTNPDMLHVGILPHHDRWGDVLHNLRFVVVDEAHVYRGVFGSHVANVLRRLRRLAAAYGAEPQFLLASATIANAGELATALTGLEVDVVANDAAPHAERDIALWNPPLLDAELGIRASALGEASRLLAALVTRELRTICFAKSRKAAELIHRFAAERVDAATAARLAPYRAGYTAEQRREIEARLVSGELLGVTATDALELGIDIGGLDCAISVGFPGTVASLRQQWGRAGRRTAGLGILVASDDALDQYFMREPDALLTRRVEAALLDHANPRILDAHVRAAAYEGPITESDAAVLGDEALARAAALPELDRTPAGWVWKGREAPAARVSLRSGDQEAFTIVEDEAGAVLGTAERERAYATVHDGAVYLHLGQQYVVSHLDLEARTAVVSRRDVDWYTQARKESATEIEQHVCTRSAAGVDVTFGRVSVTEQVIAYQRKAICGRLDARDGAAAHAGGDVRDGGCLVQPTERAARGARRDAVAARRTARGGACPHRPAPACGRCATAGTSAGSRRTSTRRRACRRSSCTTATRAASASPSAGSSSSRPGSRTRANLLRGCPCTDGCPSCVQSPKCGNLNDMLDKDAARTLLDRMTTAATPATGGVAANA